MTYLCSFGACMRTPVCTTQVADVFPFFVEMCPRCVLRMLHAAHVTQLISLAVRP